MNAPQQPCLPVFTYDGGALPSLLLLSSTSPIRHLSAIFSCRSLLAFSWIGDLLNPNSIRIRCQ
eukprot:9495585-Pyramimonas_sp.AAC.1